MRRVVSGAIAVVCAVVPARAAARTTLPQPKVTSAVVAGPASAVLRSAGLITATNATGPASLSGVQIAGDTLVATAGAGGLAAGGIYDETLDVFVKAPSGWGAAQTPAVYQPPTGEYLSQAAIGDGFIAVGDEGAAGSDVAIIVPGPAGWSGPLSESAQLSAAGGEVLTASDDSVVTGADDGPLSVFTEPTGGWSGTVAPAAQLQASDGARLFNASASGDTIAAEGVIGNDGPTAIYLFTEPVGGWSGTVQQTARIPGRSASALTLSGATLALVGAGRSLPGRGGGRQLPEFPLDIWHRPAAGWQAIAAHPPVTFIASGLFPESIASSLGNPVIAGGFVTLADTSLYDNKNCPCTSALWTTAARQTPVPASLRTPMLRSASVSGTLDSTVAADGDTVAIGAGDGIHLFTVSAAMPARIHAATLTGLRTPDPKLSLSLSSAPGAPAISWLRIVPPAGLSVSGRTAVRHRGITASGSGGVTANRGTGFTAVFLDHPRRLTTVTIGSGVLLESPSLRASIARIARRGGRRTLTLQARVADTTGRSSVFGVRFTIGR